MIADLSALPEAFRFWIDEDESSGCWIWEGLRATDGGGYWKQDGVQKRARRWAWELAGREIPAGTRVYRTCDRAECVNPDHAEAVRQKDRSLGPCIPDNRGVKNVATILTPVDVLEIRKRYAAGESTRRIARTTGMADATIRSIIKGRTWRHVTGGADIGRTKEDVEAARPVPEYVGTIRRLYAEGRSLAEVATATGKCINTVHGIVSGETWSQVTGGENIVRRRGVDTGRRSGRL